MSIQVKRRRGTAAQIAAFTGAQGELTPATDTNRLYVHDGSTAGGHPVAMLSDLVMNVVDSGVVNALVVTSTTGPATPIDGMQLSINVAVTNTAGCTLNYNGSGALPLLSATDQALVAGALQAGGQILTQYKASTGAFYLLANEDGNPQFPAPLSIAQGGTGASTQAAAKAALGVPANTNVIASSTSGTYTPTAGMKYIEVYIASAGGGGGGGGTITATGSGGGGGGGGVTLADPLTFTAAQIGASQPVYIGAGGVGGAAGGNGGVGGYTALGTLCKVYGGGGGGYGATSTIAAGGPGGSISAPCTSANGPTYGTTGFLGAANSTTAQTGPIATGLGFGVSGGGCAANSTNGATFSLVSLMPGGGGCGGGLLSGAPGAGGKSSTGVLGPANGGATGGGAGTTSASPFTYGWPYTPFPPCGGSGGGANGSGVGGAGGAGSLADGGGGGGSGTTGGGAGGNGGPGFMLIVEYF